MSKSKTKEGKSNKKAPARTLKEKRLAKQIKQQKKSEIGKI
ncbi:hypothetical protein ACRTDU_09365 [Sunxiuqinia elliptica]|uniref:Uncharacterized protein n=1 Tax=Sunxiuqinia elliptica TaxID=655355 RepID=A0A1I2FWI8_9BACT|nr:hypothetical protein [Sunxiuqinia elliptica]SFF09784.1 hypothetical protein SAMN05216283_102656 [Sunxiuqinia elliptica]